MSKNILTGLRSNAQLTLGNYLGAILPMVQLQDKLEDNDKLFLFIPDLHSFVTPIENTELYENSLRNVKLYLASGVDARRQNVFLYRQSFIPAHSELTWILSCFSYYGELGRMIQFKEKSVQQGKNVSVGLYSYPILMAADILLYGADYVPVGEDQKQHLELTRDLAIRFNNKFGSTFVEPKDWAKQLEFSNRSEGAKVRSLSDPTKKMSKSVEDPKGTILLSDEPKVAAKKIMSATTDSFGSINWDWEKQPGVTNLLQIYALLSGISKVEAVKVWQGQTTYGELKKAVAVLVEEFLVEFQTKVNQISDEEAEATLRHGEQKASIIAKRTLLKAQQAVGVRR